MCCWQLFDWKKTIRDLHTHIRVTVITSHCHLICLSLHSRWQKGHIRLIRNLASAILKGSPSTHFSLESQICRELIQARPHRYLHDHSVPIPPTMIFSEAGVFHTHQTAGSKKEPFSSSTMQTQMQLTGWSPSKTFGLKSLQFILLTAIT